MADESPEEAQKRLDVMHQAATSSSGSMTTVFRSTAPNSNRSGSKKLMQKAWQVLELEGMVDPEVALGTRLLEERLERDEDLGEAEGEQ